MVVMKRTHYILILLFALLAGACTSERHYANQFLRKHQRHTEAATETIYLCLTPTLVRTYTAYPGTAEAQGATDSLIATPKRLLDSISDSAFLAEFSNALITTLNRSKVPLVLVADEALLPAPSRDCLVLDVAALEAEEALQRVRSGFVTRGGEQFYYEHNQRLFSANGWFQLNYDTVYYFLNQEVSEAFQTQGTVLRVSNHTASVRLERRPLQVSQAYRTARSLGSLCGKLYLEKVLHEYVYRQKGRNKWYPHYTPMKNRITGWVPFDEGIRESFEVVE